MEWLNYALGAVALLGGSGGIAAFYKARQDAKQGVKQGEIDEDVAISEQWRNIIETQTKSLVDPLTGQVARLQGEVVVLQKKVTELEEQNKDHRKRELLLWQWADVLVAHIDAEKPPPAPSRPGGLERRT